MTTFQRLEMAVLADTFDGTISKEGRAELVQAFKAFKAEHAALVAVAEKANVLKWDDLPWKQRQELKQALTDLAATRAGKGVAS